MCPVECLEWRVESFLNSFLDAGRAWRLYPSISRIFLTSFYQWWVWVAPLPPKKPHEVWRRGMWCYSVTWAVWSEDDYSQYQPLCWLSFPHSVLETVSKWWGWLRKWKLFKSTLEWMSRNSVITLSTKWTRLLSSIEILLDVLSLQIWKQEWLKLL